MIRKVLAYVRGRIRDAERAPTSEFQQGALTELREVEEYVTDLMWEEGEDDEASD